MIAPLVTAALVGAIAATGRPMFVGSRPVRATRVGAPRLAVARRRFGWSSDRGGGAELAPEVARLRSAIAGGGSVAAAFEALARGGGAWSGSAPTVVAELRTGRSLAEVLDRWALGDDDRLLVADALVIAGTTGGSQVGALDAVASTMAERQALRREIRALASQATASSAVLVATPIAFAVAVAVVDARVRAFYASPIGVACVGAGAALDAFGGWWMVRLVRSVR